MEQATIAMEELFCYECGILFAMPKQVCENSILNDEEIYCPNGHRNMYEAAEPAKKPEAAESEKIKAMRAELAQAIHRADQAEARAADQRGKATPDIDEEIAALKPDPSGTEKGSCFHREPPRFQCPTCGKKYKLPACYKSHLQDHKADAIK